MRPTRFPKLTLTGSLKSEYVKANDEQEPKQLKSNMTKLDLRIIAKSIYGQLSELKPGHTFFISKLFLNESIVHPKYFTRCCLKNIYP